MKKCLLITVFALFSLSAYSGDSVTAVLHSFRANTAMRIAYQETRQLALMERPWQGSGYLYALAPNLMIKEQLQPERLLLALNHDTLLYFDPIKQIRHQMNMDIDDPLTLNIALFKALITGDQTLLENVYQVTFNATEHTWQMTLTAQEDEPYPFKTVITGKAGQPAERIHIAQQDGDSSDIVLGEQNSGASIQAKIHQLLTDMVAQ